MTKKEFTKFELARMKRTAQNVEGFLKQKNKLEAKKAKIEAELAEINEQIKLTDAPTVAMTGYHTEDIIKKIITPTDQVDKNGNIIKKVTFEFIYPDTIVPLVTEKETTASDVEDSSEETTETTETF
jgi:hypothetical protein